MMDSANKKRACENRPKQRKSSKQSDKEDCNYNTINTGDLSRLKPYSIILNLIGKGEENAIHLDKIVKVTGKSGREVRKCIETLRRNGEVIISNKNGYFKPKTPEELQKYIKQETHRAKSVFYTLKNARQLLQQIEGVN